MKPTETRSNAMPKAHARGAVSKTGGGTASREAASALLRKQHGVITCGQALACGIVRTPPAKTVDVLVPATSQRKSAEYVAIRLTTRIPEQVCYLGPVQFVLPARAVADSARWLDDLESVRATVAAAVQTGLCTVDQLAAELRSGPVQGSAFFRSALAEVMSGIRSSREAEIKDLIKRGRLPLPLFNAGLYCGDELIAVTDAWWPEAGVVAEVDSKEWHLSPKDWERTMSRHARLTALGILVLHFTPRQIRHEPAQVLATISQALASRRDHPQPTGLIRTVPAEG